MYGSFWESRETFLILFTLLFQTSLGVLLLSTYFYWKKGKYSAVRIFFLLSGVMSLCGIILSTLHLGNPLNGIWIFTQLHKPLAMEVISVVIFSVLSFCLWKRKGEGLFWVGAASLFGIFGLLAMSSIYGSMEVTHPSWFVGGVLVRFLAATFILGGFVVYLVTLFLKGVEKAEKMLFFRYSIRLGFLGLLIEAIYMPLHQMRLGAIEVGGYRLLDLVNHHSLQFEIFLGSLLIAFLLWFYDVRTRLWKEQENLSKVVPYLASLFFIVAFLLERNLFYSIQSTILF